MAMKLTHRGCMKPVFATFVRTACNLQPLLPVHLKRCAGIPALHALCLLLRSPVVFTGLMVLAGSGASGV